MEKLKIIKATLANLEALQQIGRQTFYETFCEVNSKEDMNSYLEQSFSTEKITSELQNSASQFYLCLIDDKIVGYLKLNTGKAQTENQDDNSIEIERIYVQKSFQGMRLGQYLYEKAIQIANEFESEYIWLGVWENNERAINFYKKNGFEVFSEHVFWLGKDKQTDLMMKKALKGLQ